MMWKLNSIAFLLCVAQIRAARQCIREGDMYYFRDAEGCYVCGCFTSPNTGLLYSKCAACNNCPAVIPIRPPIVTPTPIIPVPAPGPQPTPRPVLVPTPIPTPLFPIHPSENVVMPSITVRPYLPIPRPVEPMVITSSLNPVLRPIGPIPITVNAISDVSSPIARPIGPIPIPIGPQLSLIRPSVRPIIKIPSPIRPIPIDMPFNPLLPVARPIPAAIPGVVAQPIQRPKLGIVCPPPIVIPGPIRPYPVPIFVPGKRIFIPVPIPVVRLQKIYIRGPHVPVPLIKGRVTGGDVHPGIAARDIPSSKSITTIPAYGELINTAVPNTEIKAAPAIIYVSPVCRGRLPMTPFRLAGSPCLIYICKVEYNIVYVKSIPDPTCGLRPNSATWYYPGVGSAANALVDAKANTIGNGFSTADANANAFANTLGMLGGLGGATAEANAFANSGAYNSGPYADTIAQAEAQAAALGLGVYGRGTANALAQAQPQYQSQSLGGLGGLGSPFSNTMSHAQAEAQSQSAGLGGIGGGFSKAQAQALAQAAGIGGIGRLTDVEALAQTQATGLGGVSGLSQAQAQALAQAAGLGGLGGLSQAQAQAVAQAVGLGGVGGLSQAQAQALAQAVGHGGIGGLSQAQAQALAQAAAFGGTDALSLGQTQALTQVAGLGGASGLSQAQAQALAQASSLGGLGGLSQSQAQALTQAAGLGIHSSSLAQAIAQAQAQNLFRLGSSADTANNVQASDSVLRSTPFADDLANTQGSRMGFEEVFTERDASESLLRQFPFGSYGSTDTLAQTQSQTGGLVGSYSGAKATTLANASNGWGVGRTSEISEASEPRSKRSVSPRLARHNLNTSYQDEQKN